MKVAMINGSPKPGKSNTAFLLNSLEALISSGNELTHYHIIKNPPSEEAFRQLCQMDALVLAFPLYIDAIPSHLFRLLVELEEHMKAKHKNEIYVYAITNNGFYEGRQNHIAFEILKNWCQRSGLRFGQGLGHGAGEMLASNDKIPLGHGPLKNLGKAMNILANNINSKSSGELMLVNPNFPRFAWQFAGTHFFWNAEAKKNGLKKKDILRRQ